jgi:hypothetical protein
MRQEDAQCAVDDLEAIARENPLLADLSRPKTLAWEVARSDRDLRL